MNALIIILAIFIVILDATMDEMRFHWNRLFGYWFKPGKDKWWNPAVSWQNKYFDNLFLTFIFSRMLVMFTDLWHLLKFLKINSIILIILLAFNLHWSILEYATWMFMVNIVWGILFEFVMGIFGTLSDKYMK